MTKHLIGQGCKRIAHITANLKRNVYAERLRGAIGANAPLPVTASAGVAALHRNAMDAPSLVKAADAALYRAKGAGRNRVEAASID